VRGIQNQLASGQRNKQHNSLCAKEGPTRVQAYLTKGMGDLSLKRARLGAVARSWISVFSLLTYLLAGLYLLAAPSGESLPVQPVRAVRKEALANAPLMKVSASTDLPRVSSDSNSGSGSAQTPQPDASAYVPLAPYRICDTRAGNPSGLSGVDLSQCEGKTLVAGTSSQTLTIQVAGTSPSNSPGSVGVPSNATAAVLNVTVIGASGGGYLTIEPAGSAQSVVSSVNWTSAGQTVANLVQVAIGNSGSVSFTIHGSSANLAVDVEGYFEPLGNTAQAVTSALSGSASLYTPLAPYRICDTRAGNPSGLSGVDLSQCEGKTLVAGTSSQTLTIQVAGTSPSNSPGTGGVPSDATAAVLNVTVIGASAPSYVTVYPAGSQRPIVSNQNLEPGSTIPARVEVSLEGKLPGYVSIYLSGGSANVAVDVDGYYAPGSSDPEASAFYPTSPTRIADSRCHQSPQPAICPYEYIPAANDNLSLFWAGNTTQPIEAAGTASIPSWASAAVVNLTIVSSSPAGYLSAYPASSSTPPTVSDLNWSSNGAVMANLAIVKLAPIAQGTTPSQDSWAVGDPGAFYLYASGQTDAIVDVDGYFGPIYPASNPVTVVPSTLPQAIPGVAYHALLSAAGGRGGPYMWSVEGSLPPGLDICGTPETTCMMFGTPTQAGTFHFTITATADSTGTGSSGSSSAPAGIESVTLVVEPPSFGSAIPIDTTPDQMDSVSCTSSTFCAAVGSAAMIWNGSSWSSPKVIDPDEGLNGVSCASSSFCVAVDTAGQAFTWNGQTWSGGDIDSSPGYYGIMAVSCPSTSFCMAADDAGNAIKYLGAYGWQSPQSVDPYGGGFTAISCSSSSFCAALDAHGQALTFNGFSWSYRSQIDPNNGLTSISCTSSSFCMAVDYSGHAIEYVDGSWSQPTPIAPGGQGLLGVSCSSSSNCVAVDGYGGVLYFNGSEWSPPEQVDSYPHGLHSVSCPYATFCAAVSQSTTFYNGSAWSTPQPVAGATSAFLTGVSCPTSRWCMAVDNKGGAVIMQGRTWGSPMIGDPSPTGILGFLSVSCPVPGWCTAVDNDGNAVVFDGSGWLPAQPIDPGHSLISISCPQPGWCTAVDKRGYVLAEDNGVWSSPYHLDPQSFEINSISCPNTSFCMAVDQMGNAMWEIHNVWSSPLRIDPDPGTYGIESVSCSSESFCAAVDYNDNGMTWNGESWSSPTPVGDPAFGFASISCPQDGFCIAGDWIGYASTYSLGTWSSIYKTDAEPNGLTGISCPSPSFCISVDDHGAAVAASLP